MQVQIINSFNGSSDMKDMKNCHIQDGPVLNYMLDYRLYAI